MSCISSGSDGNSYLLKSLNNEALILDAGVKLADIKKALKFNVSSVVGCCITHNHSDHFYSAESLENMGISVFKPYETPKVLFKQYGGFSIKAIELTDSMGNPTHTNGDGTYCPVYAFLIEHEEMGKLLYVTDTNCVKYRFVNQKLDHILISANFDKSALEDFADAKVFHVYSGHFSIQNVHEFLKINQTENLKTVTLCHLSTNNAEPEVFRATTKELLGESVQVNIAHKGLTISLERNLK